MFISLLTIMEKLFPIILDFLGLGNFTKIKSLFVLFFFSFRTLLNKYLNFEFFLHFISSTILTLFHLFCFKYLYLKYICFSFQHTKVVRMSFKSYKNKCKPRSFSQIREGNKRVLSIQNEILCLSTLIILSLLLCP